LFPELLKIFSPTSNRLPQHQQNKRSPILVMRRWVTLIVPVLAISTPPAVTWEWERHHRKIYCLENSEKTKRFSPHSSMKTASDRASYLLIPSSMFGQSLPRHLSQFVPYVLLHRARNFNPINLFTFSLPFYGQSLLEKIQLLFVDTKLCGDFRKGISLCGNSQRLKELNLLEDSV